MCFSGNTINTWRFEQIILDQNTAAISSTIQAVIKDGKVFLAKIFNVRQGQNIGSGYNSYDFSQLLHNFNEDFSACDSDLVLSPKQIFFPIQPHAVLNFFSQLSFLEGISQPTNSKVSSSS